MAAMVWVKRFEKMMLIMAYIFTFIIVFTAGIVGKGTTFFMIAQVQLLTVAWFLMHGNYCLQLKQSLGKRDDYFTQI